MASSGSVSKGIFVFKNGAKRAKTGARKKPRTSINPIVDSLWYDAYKGAWSSIQNKLQDLNNAIYSSVFTNLVDYISGSYCSTVTEIPSAALLTGINMPDHLAQFKTFTRKLKESTTPHVAILSAEDCQNLKNLVENMINQLIREDFSDDSDSDQEVRKTKKSQCNFSYLQSWFEDLNPSNQKPLVVIIPDFESFSMKALQDFILIVSSYINILPFVIVFGVATSLGAIHRSLPYHVSSKVKLQVFQSPPSTAYLNQVLDEILFSSDSAFHLGGNVFNLFTDIFLFYDLSVSGFIQNLKYAMLEHFSYGNAMALCSSQRTDKILKRFTDNDLENVRHLMSFRKFVENESPVNRINLLTDNSYFRKVLGEEILKNKTYIQDLHLFLKCLHLLVADLPKAPLGKQIRELYSLALSRKITQTSEYKECLQLLHFQSRDELRSKVHKLIMLLDNNSSLDIKNLKEAFGDLDKVGNYEPEQMDCDNEPIANQMDRKKFREALLSKSKQFKPMNHYEKVRKHILEILSSMFENYLIQPNSLNFHEIFFFNDMSIQSHIVGSHRAAIHTALTDPHSYLQCKCCEISDDSIVLSTMPDLSIVYKLHLECGKMINLYDWLQAFLSIIDPQELEDDEKPRVKPELQARFTQAVAELEYLGFIKSSKRKTDHVARLTWGG